MVNNPKIHLFVSVMLIYIVISISYLLSYNVITKSLYLKSLTFTGRLNNSRSSILKLDKGGINTEAIKLR